MILSLDLGTNTGWAISIPPDRIISGCESFKIDRFSGAGMRYLRFSRWLDDIHGCYPFSRVVYEEVRRHACVDAAHAYGGFMSHLTAWCEQHSVPYAGVPVGTIKKHATGKGNASKDMMIAAARGAGSSTSNDNEADAICLLRWALDPAAGGRMVPAEVPA